MGAIKKIGMLTSGGDAPGMNAAIRAITRTALSNNYQAIGIKRGFNGLIAGDFVNLGSRDVSEIINRGGTILHTARSPEMLTKEGQEKAVQVCRVLGLDALIVIGGDGSYKGAQTLADMGVNVMCIPGTIDLDLGCTEYTIGFDTAVNTGADAINRLRDTSSAHERCSVVEVMGRDAGYIALWCGLVGGAEEILVPEKEDNNQDKIIEEILINRNKGKFHNLIIVAEGIGGCQELAEKIQNITGIQARATILGHLQRGGNPTAIDRKHASIMGYLAVKEIIEGKRNQVISFNRGRYEAIEIHEALKMTKSKELELYDITKILSI